MERPVVEPWSLSRSLALLAAIFAVVFGATLPTAVAASPALGHAVQLCSGERIFVVDGAAGDPAGHDPAPLASLECAACLAAGFTAVPPPPPVQVALGAPCDWPCSRAVPPASTAERAARPALRPPSTAPPVA